VNRRGPKSRGVDGIARVQPERRADQYHEQADHDRRRLFRRGKVALVGDPKTPTSSAVPTI
jgi:hypothetical protein